MNLVMPTAIPPREMPLSKSITPLKSALPMASISVGGQAAEHADDSAGNGFHAVEQALKHLQEFAVSNGRNPWYLPHRPPQIPGRRLRRSPGRFGSGCGREAPERLEAGDGKDVAEKPDKGLDS